MVAVGLGYGEVEIHLLGYRCSGLSVGGGVSSWSQRRRISCRNLLGDLIVGVEYMDRRMRPEVLLEAYCHS